MDILLDTQILLWWEMRAPRLADPARKLIATPTNRIFVSAASVWEIAIKRRRGRLAFAGSPVEAVTANSFLELVVSAADCEAAGDMDWSHTDPFDRLIVAQARRRGMTLMTADTAMQGLPGLAVVSAT